MKHVLAVISVAVLAGAIGRTQSPSAPERAALSAFFKPGVAFQDRNGDGVIDFVNARLALPEAPGDDERVAAASIAARFGFETSAMDLPVGRTSESDTGDVPTVFVGSHS